jgi:hypothetical protein
MDNSKKDYEWINQEHEAFLKIENLKNFIKQEKDILQKGIVSTYETRDDLEKFAKSNNGSMDILLMQMSINFGYKMALENIGLIIKNQ